jgi:hypothetical protein|nr:MAG TPA: hypothetical protein [Caudoviricetes sp.]
MFVNTLNIGIPYMKGATILEENRQSSQAVEGGLLRLDSPGSIASFKHLFEN